jgi:NAD(P)H-dependent FMN reductase
MPSLMIIVGSTRPGRVGLPVARWVLEAATASGRFDRIDLADLAAIDLPFMDEPSHPRLRRYEHQHTKDWSARVDAADAFVLVTPEYNYGMPAPLKNAIDYLHHEWTYKPVGFVSYGGVSGGTRSVQMAKQVVTAFPMVPVPSVVVPFVHQHLDQDGVIKPNETMERAAAVMFDELARVAQALHPLRAPREATV